VTSEGGVKEKRFYLAKEGGVKVVTKRGWSRREVMKSKAKKGRGGVFKFTSLNGTQEVFSSNGKKTWSQYYPKTSWRRG